MLRQRLRDGGPQVLSGGQPARDRGAYRPGLPHISYLTDSLKPFLLNLSLEFDAQLLSLPEGHRQCCSWSLREYSPVVKYAHPITRTLHF